MKKLDIRIYDGNDVSIYFLCLFYGPRFLFFASLILVINILQVDGLIKTELFQLSHIVALILIHEFDKLIIIYSLLNIIFIIHLFQGICFHPKVYLSNFVFQNALHSKDHIRITCDKLSRDWYYLYLSNNCSTYKKNKLIVGISIFHFNIMYYEIYYKQILTHQRKTRFSTDITQIFTERNRRGAEISKMIR